jgi:two-component system chemotaxis sensor kinase CheA
MTTENNYAMLNDPEMKEIVESFIVETKEILEKLDLNLIELENRPEDTELLNEIFRSFHTIKGTSGFLGLDKLTQVTHRCEDILNKLRKGEALLDSDLMDGILSAFDQIKELLATIETNSNENVSVDETVEILNKLINKLENKGTENIKAAVEPSNEIKETKKNIEIEPDVSAIQAEQSPVVEEKSSVKEPSKAVAAGKKSDNTIRVDVDRLDELLNIASELVLGRNRLAQVNSEIALEYEGSKISRDLSDAAKQIDLMTNELQLVVMKTRMVKIGKVFNRYPRLVRDLARDTKKEVNLILKGEDTELDKTLIEEINDPLVHLIRNAVDHGIESPEKRKQDGKNPIGTVILSAEQEGNQIIITIEDDGKGIDTELLKEKAVSKGLITKEKAKELSKQDAYNIIFVPGFSTAEKVTNVSGRGVGLDVVKTNVSKLRGIISIDSTVGRGTKMIVKLPLTLAIISGMIVEVKAEKVVIPLNSVIEVLRVHVEDIHTINNHEAIRRRDSIIPLVSIDNVLYNDKADKDKGVWQYVVVIGLAEKRFGIKVDELLGQKEVVIKSLGNYLGNINGIAGSTIMGDGTVVMILDISELLNQIAE